MLGVQIVIHIIHGDARDGQIRVFIDRLTARNRNGRGVVYSCHADIDRIGGSLGRAGDTSLSQVVNCHRERVGAVEVEISSIDQVVEGRIQIGQSPREGHRGLAVSAPCNGDNRCVAQGDRTVVHAERDLTLQIRIQIVIHVIHGNAGDGQIRLFIDRLSARNHNGRRVVYRYHGDIDRIGGSLSRAGDTGLSQVVNCHRERVGTVEIEIPSIDQAVERRIQVGQTPREGHRGLVVSAPP